MNVDNCGPAGSITSTVVDMAQWVRFLLNRGTYAGKRLVRAEAFDELWRDDDPLMPNYGQGWFIHPGDAELAADKDAKLLGADTQSWKDADGKRHLVVEHGGNVPGFAAEVALLPDFHVGLVMLSNVSGTQLQAGIVDLVFDGLLGPWHERRKSVEGKALVEGQTKGWLGAYSEGRLGIPPRALQRGSDHLVLVFPAAPGQVTPAAFTLMWAAADGRFWLREDPDAYVTIDRSDKGAVESLTLVRNGDARVMKPLPPTPPAEPPDVNIEEFMTARMTATGSVHGDALKNLRLTGTMSLPQSGIRGRYVLVAQGLEKLRIEYDAGKFGHSLVVVDGNRGFSDNHFSGYEVLKPSECATLQFANPLLEQGNWLDHSEECEVVGRVRNSALGLPISELGGIFTEVRVKPADADPLVYYVDPTNLTAMVEGPTAFPGIPNALPFARLSLVNPVGKGLKIPFRRVATEPQVGQLILQIDKVELDVDLPADTFAIRPPPAADAKSGS
jgi:hypothetical protein